VSTHFFQTFDDWSLKLTKKTKRPVLKPRVDSRLPDGLRQKFADLTAEVRAWETADAAVVPLAGEPFTELPVEPTALGVRLMEDLIFETDRIAQRISAAYSQGQEIDLAGQELAEMMRAVAEASPALG
jgi:hypothetical protein